MCNNRVRVADWFTLRGRGRGRVGVCDEVWARVWVRVSDIVPARVAVGYGLELDKGSGSGPG